MLSLHFDQPEFLLLALLAIPLVWIGWRALALSDSLRRGVILSVRTVLLLLITVILAGPRLQKAHDHLTVIGLLDISGSVQRFGAVDLKLTTPGRTTASAEDPDSPTAAAPIRDISSARPGADRSSIIEHLRQWFRTAAQIKEPDDRFGLVVFDGKAIAVSAPTKSDYVDDNLDVPIAAGTNIEDAVRLGLAMFPPDTAKRIVLVTDGNETAGSVTEAIKQLSKGSNVQTSKGNRDVSMFGRFDVSIDVLPVTYRVTRDVQVVRVEAPPSAQPGQTVMARIVLESTAPVSGRLTLRREGEPVDLNGDQPGTTRRLTIPAGQSVHLAQIALGHTPINRFEAVFETDDPADNLLPDNDRAEAFTATPSKGSVLIVDSKIQRRDNLLAQILNAADVQAAAQLPSQFPDDLLSLQNFDLIVLDDIAAFELSPYQQELIARYVNDMGGGLIMAGGENSFGAGGWKGSPVAALLPVNVDPKRELRLPTAALVLVLDKSGSMNQPVAGARATQQQIANEGAALAVESLRSDNLVGVITFDLGASTLVPLRQNEDPKRIADRVRGINAEGGTNLEAALLAAHDMIKDAPVAKKRIVFLTDGRSSSTEDLEQIAHRMKAADIQLTTIAVGDDADYEVLEKLANVGGGQFYPVRDPRMLPRVLIDSVQVINKPLLKEISFVPRVLATGSTLTIGLDGPDAPALQGLVITSMREDRTAVLEMVDSENEPLLAHWQAGLGRVAAFTSQIPGSGPWSQQWVNWPTAATFWTQLARMTARPAMSQDAELIATIKDDRLIITFDAGGDPENSSESGGYLRVEGVVYQPDGSAIPVRLRQTAAGLHETSLPAQAPGNYIVAVNPRRGAKQLPPAIGGANSSSNPEFRRYESNLALLDEILERTGGRRLNINDPNAAALFDRTGMPPSVSSLPAWRTILWWTLAFLLLDVASRRIAWDSILLRSMVARALARITPARVRGAQAAATLATLRRVSDAVEMRQEARSAGVKRFEPTGRVAPPPERYENVSLFDADATPVTSPGIPKPDRDRKNSQPDAAQVAAALDALLGRGKTPTQPETSATPSAPQPDPGANAADTTGSLLAAKRRTREKLDRADEHKR